MRCRQVYGRDGDHGLAQQSDWVRPDNGRTDRAHPVGEAYFANLQPIQTQPSKQQQQRPRRGSGASSQGGRTAGSARSVVDGGGPTPAEDLQQRNFALHSAPSSPARALQQQHAHVFFGGAPHDVHAARVMANGGVHGGGPSQPPMLARHDRSRSFTSLGGLAAASQAQHAAQQAQHYAQQQAHQHAAQQSHQQQQAAAAALAANPFKALSAMFAPQQLAALAAANGARHRLQVLKLGFQFSNLHVVWSWCAG